MRLISGVTVAVVVGCLYGVSPARADHQPVIAVPGHPQAPVLMNGADASWAMIEGEWGYYRPGHMAPTVSFPYPPDGWRPPAYYPFTGKRPRLGRHEIIPPANRPLPPPAESYFRYWSNDGASVPAQTETYTMPPPAVIVAPHVRGLN